MIRESGVNRRGLLSRIALGLGALGLGGCSKIADTGWGQSALHSVENLTRLAQRQLLSVESLAPEFAESDLSPVFKPNGSTNPDDEDYLALAQTNFADYRLEVDGLVERPLKLSLEDIRALPSRTQITRHDCVEGWSCIGKWKGVKLGDVLGKAGLKSSARYIVFHCFDTLEQTLDGSGLYYESIDLGDAFHAQTILAYELNGQTLPIANGAPLRVRIERQLGYKMAKYIRRIEAVENFGGLSRGKGGFWEDRGYEWYAGI